jgi:hypothetical protein
MRAYLADIIRVINVYTRSLQVGVTAVEDSLVVVSPRKVAELGLFQNFRKVLSGLDVLEVDVEPVGARFAEAVGEDRSILVYDNDYQYILL